MPDHAPSTDQFDDAVRAAHTLALARLVRIVQHSPSEREARLAAATLLRYRVRQPAPQQVAPASTRPEPATLNAASPPLRPPTLPPDDIAHVASVFSVPSASPPLRRVSLRRGADLRDRAGASAPFARAKPMLAAAGP